MEKRYILCGLDCANCAEEIRRTIEQSDFAESAHLNFFSKELTVHKKPEISDERLFDEISRIVKKLEPDVEPIEKSEYKEEKISYAADIAKIVISAVLFFSAFAMEHFFSTDNNIMHIVIIVMYAAAFITNAYEVAITAFKSLLSGNFFNENTLMLIASVGAIILGEYEEAVAVMLFYSVGELFQTAAVNRSRRSISSLIKAKPETAELLTDNGYVTVSPEAVSTGSTIRVKAGEKIPLDGIVTSGASSVDTSAITGESMPRDIAENDVVPAGAINLSGVITLKTTSLFTDSTVYKMLKMVESAVEKKTKTENFVSVFARYYTPIVVFAALMLAAVVPLFTGFDFSTWIQRALIFLVISCPCALVISVPLGYFAGIGNASSKGILVKGSSYLEAVSKAKAVLFDKTGTLTKGEFEVTAVRPAGGISEQELLRTAAYAESASNHPIAVSVKSAYGKEIDSEAIVSCEEIAGKGVKAVIDGKAVLCGNKRLLSENNIICPEADGTVLYTAIDGQYAGSIEISDIPKETSAEAVKYLKSKGIDVIMLTGDNYSAAKAAAEKIGVDKFYSGLLPQDKSEITEKIKAKSGKGEKVIFVGDGINDAPVLAAADIGIAMGGKGADSAIETADIVLMKDDPMQLADAYTVSRRTNLIVIQNIVFAISVKLIIQILGVLGLAGMWAAVFADVGVSVLAILNSLRLMRK